MGPDQDAMTGTEFVERVIEEAQRQGWSEHFDLERYEKDRSKKVTKFLPKFYPREDLGFCLGHELRENQPNAAVFKVFVYVKQHIPGDAAANWQASFGMSGKQVEGQLRVHCPNAKVTDKEGQVGAEIKAVFDGFETFECLVAGVLPFVQRRSGERSSS